MRDVCVCVCGVCGACMWARCVSHACCFRGGKEAAAQNVKLWHCGEPGLWGLGLSSRRGPGSSWRNVLLGAQCDRKLSPEQSEGTIPLSHTLLRADITGFRCNPASELLSRGRDRGLTVRGGHALVIVRHAWNGTGVPPCFLLLSTLPALGVCSGSLPVSPWPPVFSVAAWGFLLVETSGQREPQGALGPAAVGNLVPCPL